MMNLANQEQKNDANNSFSRSRSSTFTERQNQRIQSNCREIGTAFRESLQLMARSGSTKKIKDALCKKNVFRIWLLGHEQLVEDSDGYRIDRDYWVE